MRTLALVASLALLAGCAAGDAGSPAPGPTMPRDIHSFARPEEARVTHVDLDLTADFDSRTLAGTATLDLEIDPDADELALDTRDLAVDAVTDARGNPLPFTLGDADPILGRPLEVDISGQVRRVVVHYRTSPSAGALQWLDPAQTAGKGHPYLFSQGQAILTRTWIPTQDSPGVRQTYAARIVVPEGLSAVMSAESLTPGGEPSGAGRAFRFALDRPIPPYLIAIAVGDLAFRPLGERTGVYTEPATLEAAASELVDMERMVEAAEGLYGPYRWGRFDVLVLPPSFPFGGMENPRLTFATPTILAGDRSLVSLIAHELAHSWSGNLVTNATWSDFWLNEGFTTYFENRIMEALYGADRAAMLASLGWQDLQVEIAGLGGPDAPDTRLHIDLAGRDPDEGMTSVPYEKGAALLRTIEKAVGRERWDAYLRAYFDRHAFKPQTTEGFIADLRLHLLAGDERLEASLALREWIYEPGLPGNAVVPASDAFARIDAVARAFAAGAPAREIDTTAWTTQEWQHFLGALPEMLTPSQLADLDRSMGLSVQGNSEILFSWLRVATRNRYDPAVPALEAFLTGQGRRKFLTPLYEELMRQGEWGQPLARRIYARARPTYHNVSVATVDGIVN